MGKNGKADGVRGLHVKKLDNLRTLSENFRFFGMVRGEKARGKKDQKGDSGRSFHGGTGVKVWLV